jgi:hypothetical protein
VRGGLDDESLRFARGPIALGNVIYDELKARVILKTRFNAYLGENVHLLDAEDFIARLVQFIPPRRVRYIRYYGLYSSRSRGKWASWRAVCEVAPEGWRSKHDAAPRVPEPAACGPPNSSWARLIARVYETDPLVCLRCSSPMKVVAVGRRGPGSAGSPADPAAPGAYRAGAAGAGHRGPRFLCELIPALDPLPGAGERVPDRHSKRFPDNSRRPLPPP